MNIRQHSLLIFLVLLVLICIGIYKVYIEISISSTPVFNSYSAEEKAAFEIQEGPILCDFTPNKKECAQLSSRELEQVIFPNH